jgi:hypothetical protein
MEAQLSKLKHGTRARRTSPTPLQLMSEQHIGELRIAVAPVLEIAQKLFL